MKKKISWVLGILLISVAIVAQDYSKNSMNQTVMILNTAASELTIKLIGKGAATVQWGDVRTMQIPELVSEDGETVWREYTHTYSSRGIHRITITGENIIALDCDGAKLNSLDVTGNAALAFLDCSNNQLTVLDLSNNFKLDTLSCYDNQLTTLKISGEAPLSNLMCQRNHLQAGTLNVLFETLSRNEIDENIVDISDNPGSADSNVTIAENKGRKVSNNFVASLAESTREKVIVNDVVPADIPKPDFGTSTTKTVAEWNLTQTMKAELRDNGWLWITSLSDSEAMPDFDSNNPAPWASVRDSIRIILIEDEVTTIGSHAFEDCSNLESISINNYSIKSIGEEAFRNCTSLQWLSIDTKKPPRIPENLFASINISEVSLYVPIGAAKRYQSAEVWKDFGNIDGINSPPPGVDDFLTSTSTEGEKAMTWCIFLLSIVLFLMRITKEKGQPREGISYIISNTLFLAVCVVEIIYLPATKSSMWFCSPDIVGWMWTVINFFLLAGVVYNQVLYGKGVFEDISAKGNVEINIYFGLFSWGVALIFLVIFGIFYKPAIPWVFGILGILQIIQCILIFIAYGKNWKGASFGVFTYLLGTAGTVAVSSVLIGILIIIVLGLAVLWIAMKILNASSSSSSPGERGIGYCNTCRYYLGRGQYCNRGNKTVDHHIPACTEYIRD